MQKKIQLSIIAGFSLILGAFGQDEKDLGTETVTVVKPYSPTVSDAFKIKSAPILNDSIVLAKKEIRYSIFSVPVASTFTPAKGKAATVQKATPEKLYNSYVSLGLGNFNNALLDFYTSRDIDRGNKRVDIGLNHFSSRGDLDFTPLDTDFYNTKLEAAYSNRGRDFDWGISSAARHQLYNWYGLPEGVFDEVTIAGIDEKQQYFNVELGAHLNQEDSFLSKGEVLVKRFWDKVESAENRGLISTTFNFPLSEEDLTITVKGDYVGGEFINADVNNTANTPAIPYSQFQVGISPSILIVKDELSLNLGANLVYGMDGETNESNFYIYPQVTASYRLLEDMVIVYGGVTGQLTQNSYADYVDDNPYVSPTLTIQPTDQQYDARIGFKGQLFPNLSYNIRGSYSAENRKPLFKLNPQNSFRDDEKGYYYGNSFEVFYDDVKTLGIFGELNVDINRNFTLGVNASIYEYDTETDNPAWNLPNLKGSLFMDYQIDEQWFMGANIFFVGEREDLSAVVIPNTQPSDYPASILTLDSYFDANAHIGYRLSEQLSIFAKASNLANNDYQQWANFRVQSFQILAGATYKFDF
ncbi:TonB-dependent receptor [uncultured Muriicola sp.]|uniref:TonB-dependent receptor domain-containing protein n=1 Tax=uncultured Muriicola sp. TaxID=1583102 RepID=UPI0026390985|nr:TonB-dependent receptor [uncultured Muriicola sp.]